MEHHSWQQIRICGDWKVDFEMFPEFNDAEKEMFIDECGIQLECLAKAEVQYVYESRYVSRFLNFASRLDQKSLYKTSFKDLKLVGQNAGEPFQTHRDLMMSCYTKRFEIQTGRIEI
jgi:hypothetical protein